METSPARQWGPGGLGDPKHVSQSQPPSPPSMPHPPREALLEPHALCHREPGAEPMFFISSHLLWQPHVCLVFTSQDAWILSLLDHTRGASQCFPSAADIFLMMLFPPQPFSPSSPSSSGAAPAVNAQPQCWARGSGHASLLAPGEAPWAARLSTAFSSASGCKELSSV